MFNPAYKFFTKSDVGDNLWEDCKFLFSDGAQHWSRQSLTKHTSCFSSISKTKTIRLNYNLLNSPSLLSPLSIWSEQTKYEWHLSPSNIVGEVSWGQNIVMFLSNISLPTNWSDTSSYQKKICNLSRLWRFPRYLDSFF